MAPVPKGKLAKRRGNQSASRSSAPRPSPTLSSPSSASPGFHSRKRRASSDLKDEEEPDTEVVCDDPYGDDYEQEKVIHNSQAAGSTSMKSKQANHPSGPVVFCPGKHGVSEGEELVCDETAYDIFYKCNVEWPALSFDYICMRADGEYDNMDPAALHAYPLSVSLVLGTQAQSTSNNKLLFLRMSNLHRNVGKKSRQIKRGKDSDDDSSDSDSDDGSDDGGDVDTGAKANQSASPDIDRNGLLQSAEVKADATINRVRVMPQRPNIVAYWSENGRVSLVDGTPALNTLHLDSRTRMQAPTTPLPSSVKPFFSNKSHRVEGYALDWSRVVPGRLLSGGVDGGIYLTQPASETGATWVTSPDRYRGHKSSVEDLQWSPNERDVFCSCSADQSIRVWDTREYRRPAVGIVKAYDTDVNVISWNRLETHLLASGGDDGVIKVWDLRSLKREMGNETALPAAEFAQHQKAITAVQWHPTDASMLCASSEDGSVTVWDLAVERDAEEEIREGDVIDGAEEFPPQLLFIHMGQKNVKDAQWHPACPSLIVSTAEDGLNVFQPSNIALPAS